QAGPRSRIYFNPAGLSCGIVTCGGLCPGLNDVIRSIVMTLSFGYGVKRIVGFPYGYAGLTKSAGAKPLLLNPKAVGNIHEHGGTILGSSRGAQDVAEMVDTLVSWDIGILFAIGGDGTLRGAGALTGEIEKRHLPISVIGIPKTIDNDLEWIARSFGFITAVHEARPAILAAHAEATAANNGVGLVMLMGRHSGFIATSASLANPDVNFCLIPEVPFTLRGDGGFLPVLFNRLERRQHAVVVVAEGAGQELFEDASVSERDASGNVKLKDIGALMRAEIRRYSAERNVPVGVKYIDPSYTIRSQPANSNDSAYCLVLGQNAVHAGMAGRTGMVVGFWGNKFTHVPIEMATGRRKQVDPRGEAWQFLLQMTGQPASMQGH
ncbi:MAG: ATP-dependent 6-phosphofructokinase, partial [bacterium]|nr:ATP-dependent 6-phosphofructokinase [bacterium]